VVQNRKGRFVKNIGSCVLTPATLQRNTIRSTSCWARRGLGCSRRWCGAATCWRRKGKSYFTCPFRNGQPSSSLFPFLDPR